MSNLGILLGVLLLFAPREWYYIKSNVKGVIMNSWWLIDVMYIVVVQWVQWILDNILYRLSGQIYISIKLDFCHKVKFNKLKKQFWFS